MSDSSEPTENTQRLPKRVRRPVYTARGQTFQWEDLRPDEQDAILDCATSAGIRATAGFGAVLSLCAFARAYFERLRVVPRWAGILSVTTFGLAGAYGAALTAVPSCIQSIRGLPDSSLATALDETLADWNSS
ncbi:hypothetical protein GpartN1_g3535.t1 [Galdieria partita]|uniref:Uncharacterized protein n=1 Tax=Galdieria partita TaxID=83374 RepID=A0A9C7PWH8_9RHOD|nr:hypothetical protein GpartN1_g3535.t1 [Galdieria partita]